jgi:hypothetical protein
MWRILEVWLMSVLLRWHMTVIDYAGDEELKK